MAKENLAFGDIEIEKHKFYGYEIPIFLGDVHIDNILVSNKIYSSGKVYKCFIGYFYDDYKIKPLSIVLPKATVHV